MKTPTHPSRTLATEAKRFLIERELAARWRVSTRTLSRWRANGIAPAHHVMGRRVLYAIEDIEAAEGDARQPGYAS